MPADHLAARQNLPPSDAPVLAARVDLLVTGDRSHFGHLFGTTIGGVTVVLPGDAMARVLEARPGR